MNALPTSIPLPHTDEGIRICQVLGLKADKVEEYKKHHAAVWPTVLEGLRKSKIVDYSIHLIDLPFGPQGANSQHILIAHMRYMGRPEDFEQDMAEAKKDSETRRWWGTSFIDGAVGSAEGPGWWMNAEEVFRFEG